MPKEQYMCQLCANHGIFNQPKKGHKQKCPFRSCLCNSCGLNSKRRALDQIERKLRVKESPSPPSFSQIPSNGAPYIKPPQIKIPSTDASSNFVTNMPSQTMNSSNFVSQQSNISSLMMFSIPLPSTIPTFPPMSNVNSSLSNLKLLKQEVTLPNVSNNGGSNDYYNNQLPYILSEDDPIEEEEDDVGENNISKERRSIFHSVKMLAGDKT
uniref:DM domain-containing protein n=1 Tax=Parastrongyloides trichosuri TaxID=131310 RepID=A0A0N4ZQ69_PARTI